MECGFLIAKAMQAQIRKDVDKKLIGLGRVVGIVEDGPVAAEAARE